MKKKLHILMTTMQMGFGGAETHIYELCRALQKDGHTVTVASAGGEYADLLENCGIRHVTLPLATKNPADVLRAYTGLKKLIRAERFDVVHAHARIPAFICGLLQKKLHFPFVTTAHWVFKLTPLWRRISNWGDRQMAVSEDIKQYLIDEYGEFADHISVTVNGIDTETFSPDADGTEIITELGLSDSKHRIVTVSRMDESRGLAPLCLAKAAEVLIERYPDLEVIVVGDGVIPTERNLLADVRVIADRLEKAHGRKVIFTPGLRSDTPKFIAAGNIFVGASRAALEAMSCGKPTIVAGNEGYIGIFDESRREIAYKTNYCCRGQAATTPDLLVRDLAALFEGDLAAHGDYCRRVILEDFSAARTARDYEKLYEALPVVSPVEKGEILISGYYGFGNAGDDSVAASVIRGIRAVKPDAKITVFAKDPKRSAKKYGVRAIGRFDLFALLREMRGAKLLLFGGGNLLQNTTSSRSLLYYTTILRLAKAHKLKIFVCANGVGPIFGKRSERSVADVLAFADAISFREPQSLEYAVFLGVDRTRVCLTADPALTLTPAPAARIDYILRDLPDGRRFAVSLRNFSSLRSEEVAGTDEETFARAFATEVDKIADATGATPLYLIMQSGKDLALCERVNALARHKGVILPSLTAPEILGVLDRCDLVIGMRLHLLIYGAAAKKPLIGVAYDPKIASMLDYMGYEMPIRVQEIANGKLAEKAIVKFGSTAPTERIETLQALVRTDAETAVNLL